MKPVSSGAQMSDTNLRFLDHPSLPHLSTDLVIGHIRWSRALGLPEGGIHNAIVIRCYHWNLIAFDPLNPNETSQGLKFPHIVDAWEGQHDDHYYRLTFTTVAITPDGYEQDDNNPLRTINILDVAFRDGMIWKHIPSTRAGIKLLRPTYLEFKVPGHAQILPDIEVISVPPSFYR
jgi:hypothetical protein